MLLQFSQSLSIPFLPSLLSPRAIIHRIIAVTGSPSFYIIASLLL